MLDLGRPFMSIESNALLVDIHCRSFACVGPVYVHPPRGRAKPSLCVIMYYYTFLKVTQRKLVSLSQTLGTSMVIIQMSALINIWKILPNIDRQPVIWDFHVRRYFFISVHFMTSCHDIINGKALRHIVCIQRDVVHNRLCQNRDLLITRAAI